MYADNGSMTQWTVRSMDRQTNRQTDKRTYTLIEIRGRHLKKLGSVFEVYKDGKGHI